MVKKYEKEIKELSQSNWDLPHVILQVCAKYPHLDSKILSHLLWEVRFDAQEWTKEQFTFIFEQTKKAQKKGFYKAILNIN